MIRIKYSEKMYLPTNIVCLVALILRVLGNLKLFGCFEQVRWCAVPLSFKMLLILFF